MTSQPAHTPHPATPAPGPDLSRCPGVWDDCREVSCDAVRVQGVAPPGIVGTLFRNGPGKRSLSSSYFDGDGMIRRLHVGPDGRVQYRSRYVLTPKFLKQLTATRPLVRTAGTQASGGMRANFLRLPANEANTHVIQRGSKLYALYEGALPYELDPVSLETRGIETFHHTLSPRVPFSAHPHEDPSTGELYNFGMSFGLRGGTIRAFKLSRDGRIERVGSVPLEFNTFLHDFGLSQRWMGFLISPVTSSMGRLLLGLESVFDGLKWMEGASSELCLLSRDGSTLRRFELPAHSPHHVIAMRDEGDDVVLDTVHPDGWTNLGGDSESFRGDPFPHFGRHRQWRTRVNLRTGRVDSGQLAYLAADFPRSDERRPMHAYRYAYLAAAPAPDVPGLPRAVAKLDLVTGEHKSFDFGVGCAVAEPVFAPDPARIEEDAGVLLCLVYDAKRRASNLVALDAQHPDAGPVCTWHLPVSAGLTFHGSWVPDEDRHHPQ